MSAFAPNQGNRVLYFDCYSGISGDMALGALLDCGAVLEDVQQLLQNLNLPGWRLQAEKVIRHGLSGTSVTVAVTQPGRAHRGLREITVLIGESALPQPVKDKSIAIFKHLAQAEAAVHGVTVEQVQFHEVGAVDAIIDIVGSVAALYLLKINSIYCSPLPVGRGTVQTAHGLIPLPGPAVMELFKSRQVPVYGVESSWELVTPTGAAIVSTLAEFFGPAPPLAVEGVGYGAGQCDPGYPNYLRVLIGTDVSTSSAWEERVMEIEANIDDLNPEIYGFLMEKLLEEGALDVYFTPIQMKKNRPAVKLAVLTSPQNLNLLLDTIFCETSTLGVRVYEGRKMMRLRAVETVQTDWGPVRVKIVPAEDGRMPLHFAPEYEDCRAIAARTGLPLKEIYRRVDFIFLRQRSP